MFEKHLLNFYKHVDQLNIIEIHRVETIICPFNKI